MTVYKGNTEQSELSRGSNAFAEGYKGSQKIYARKAKVTFILSDDSNGTVEISCFTENTFTLSSSGLKTYTFFVEFNSWSPIYYFAGAAHAEFKVNGVQVNQLTITEDTNVLVYVYEDDPGGGGEGGDDPGGPGDEDPMD